MTELPSGIYTIRLAFQGNVWAGIDDGMRIVHVVENSQRFIVTRLDDGTYTIQVLYIPGPGPFLYRSDTYIRFGDDQYPWFISPLGNGSYTIAESYDGAPSRLWTLGPQPFVGTPIHLEGETPPPPVQNWYFDPVADSE